MKRFSRASRHALTVLVAAALAAPVVAAQADPDRAEPRGASWASETRIVDFSVGATGFDYQSRRSSERGEDLIEGEFSSTDATLEYRFVSTEPRNETVLTAALRFVALVEFRDLDGDGRYGLEDRVVARTDIASLPGATVEERREITTGVHRVAARYPLPPPPDEGLPVSGGAGPLTPREVVVMFLITPAPTMWEGDPVAPVALRLDVDVNGYAYAENGTRLALEQRFTTNAPVRADARQVAAQKDFFDLSFAWNPQVVADGVTLPADVRVLEEFGLGDTQALILRSFPRANSVLFDGTLSPQRYNAVPGPVVLPIGLMGDATLYVIGTLFTVGAVAVPAWHRLRRGS